MDSHCEWNESKHDQQCEQRGLPTSASVSGILIKELLRLGLLGQSEWTNTLLGLEVIVSETGRWRRQITLVWPTINSESYAR